MPILYATEKMLKSYDVNDSEIMLNCIEWYDDKRYIDVDDMIEVNTVEFLSLVNQKEKIISVYISNIKELKIDDLNKLESVEHIKLEAIESITFCDFNDNLKLLQINYCALNYPPQIPKNLIKLDLSMNLIDSMEHSVVPDSLKVINLNDNHFHTFPLLNDNVETIYICNNYIKKVENLPANLKKLFVGNNFIEEMPILDDSIISDIKQNPINTINMEV